MYKVMIVDDVEIFRRDFKRLRIWEENPDFVVCEEASDGLDALKKLEKNPMDVLFIDIKMPRMDGIELLRIVSERNLCPFSILLSDYTEYHYARQGFINGAFDYIGKTSEEKEFTDLLLRIRKKNDVMRLEEKKRFEYLGTLEDNFFSTSELSLLVQLIGTGDALATQLAADMIETIRKAVSDDRIKAMSIIRSAGEQVIKLLFLQYQWLPLFFEVKLFEKINPLNCNNWKDVTDITLEIADHIIALIHRFVSRYDNQLVNQICEYILTNIHEKLSVKIIAEKMYISKPHLSEIFKQNTGITLLEYITTAKMERAKILLADDNIKIYEIAYQLGFQDNEYFNKVFKKYNGMSLTEYRKNRNQYEQRGW